MTLRFGFELSLERWRNPDHLHFYASLTLGRYWASLERTLRVSPPWRFTLHRGGVTLYRWAWRKP